MLAHRRPRRARTPKFRLAQLAARDLARRSGTPSILKLNSSSSAHALAAAALAIPAHHPGPGPEHGHGPDQGESLMKIGEIFGNYLKFEDLHGRPLKGRIKS